MEKLPSHTSRWCNCSPFQVLNHSKSMYACSMLMFEPSPCCAGGNHHTSMYTCSMLTFGLVAQVALREHSRCKVSIFTYLLAKLAVDIPHLVMEVVVMAIILIPTVKLNTSGQYLIGICPWSLSLSVCHCFISHAVLACTNSQRCNNHFRQILWLCGRLSLNLLWIVCLLEGNARLSFPSCYDLSCDVSCREAWSSDRPCRQQSIAAHYSTRCLSRPSARLQGAAGPRHIHQHNQRRRVNLDLSVSWSVCI